MVLITRRCHSWLPTVLLGSIVLVDVSFLKRIFNLCTEVEMVKLIDSLSSSSDAKRTAVNVFCDSLSLVQISKSWVVGGACFLKKHNYRDLHRYITKQTHDKFGCLP